MADGTTVTTLLDALGLGKVACAIEVNGQLVPKSEHDRHVIVEGDLIEAVTLVGGG